MLTGSMASFLDGPAGMAMYGASKHGLLGFFRSLRHEVSDHAVRINMVCPYFLDTPMIPLLGKMILAGVEKVEVEEVVDAAEWVLCEEKGTRCVVVAPKGAGGAQEVNAMEERPLEAFSARVIGLMKTEKKWRKNVRLMKDLKKIFGVWKLMGVLGVVVGGVVVSSLFAKKLAGF